jgi:hypothetical protein
MPDTVRYVSATQAARLIGVNERTVRLWIEKHKLSASRPAPNKLDIPMSEVNRIIDERLARQSIDKIPTPRELAASIEDLQHELETINTTGQAGATLTARIDALEERLQRIEQRQPVQSRSTPEDRHTSASLPPGALLARDFATQHGVSPRTFTDHITKGIRGERTPAQSRPKPGRPGETERFLLPEEQRAALEFWQRNNVTYHDPESSADASE